MSTTLGGGNLAHRCKAPILVKVVFWGVRSGAGCLPSTVRFCMFSGFESCRVKSKWHWQKARVSLGDILIEHLGIYPEIGE